MPRGSHPDRDRESRGQTLVLSPRSGFPGPWLAWPRRMTNEPPLCRPLEPPPPSRATGSYRPATSSVGQCDFPFFCSPRRVAKRLKNVFTLQVGVRGQHLVYGVTRADELDDCADRHAHGTYRGLAAHEVGVVGDSVEVRHGVTLTQGPRTVDRYPPQPFQTAERRVRIAHAPRAGARRPARRERLPPRGTGSAPRSTHSSPFGLMILAVSAGRTSHDALQIWFELRTLLRSSWSRSARLPHPRPGRRAAHACRAQGRGAGARQPPLLSGVGARSGRGARGARDAEEPRSRRVGGGLERDRRPASRARQSARSFQPRGRLQALQVRLRVLPLRALSAGELAGKGESLRKGARSLRRLREAAESADRDRAHSLRTK